MPLHYPWASMNLPGYSGNALAAHDLAERLDLGRVKDGGDGVERLESRGSDLGFEIYHCQNDADAGVGGENLRDQVCIRIFVWFRLVLRHCGQDSRRIVVRVDLDATPNLMDRMCRQAERCHDP